MIADDLTVSILLLFSIGAEVAAASVSESAKFSNSSAIVLGTSPGAVGGTVTSTTSVFCSDSVGESSAMVASVISGDNIADTVVDSGISAGEGGGGSASVVVGSGVVVVGGAVGVIIGSEVSVTGA